ncbi:MAG: nitroreductase family protein [Eubacteriaceae bacterium]
MKETAKYIYKRKSIRKYEKTPLDPETMRGIEEAIAKVIPLYPEIKYEIDMVSKIKIPMKIDAPYYLLFSSEEKDGCFENIGFIGQQINLYLASIGLGACWLGLGKPEEKETTNLPFVICMSFGKAAEPLYREVSEFKRKRMDDICNGKDSRLEGTRVAPSAMNAQNWYFSKENNLLHCYRKKANPLMGFVLNRMNSIDMGIALCHIFEESKEFSFKKEPNPPKRKGTIYIGTVTGE